ncbi:MAG TPA: hypothetical protein VIS77_01005 [Burkholderiales bacterium]
MRNLPELVSAVQHNCDVSDARHAGEYGLCTFLLKMREYYRWENELPFSRALPKDAVGEWLAARERQWGGLETEPFRPLPIPGGALDPLDGGAVNAALGAQGLVYSAGYGQFRKPVFFLGKLLRAESREGFTILVSSCEYARELAAPPAMLQGRTIFIRLESVRRFLWEKIEDGKWRKRGSAMARALDGYDFAANPESALARMAECEMESMILHELGEARAGERLGAAWRDMTAALSRPRSELVARAVRDLIADCLSTLPVLLARRNHPALHFYFATFDGLRRELFPDALAAYAAYAESGTLEALETLVREGATRWLEVAQSVLATTPAAREGALEMLLAARPARTAPIH